MDKQSGKLLVVDDDPEVLAFLKLILEGTEWQIDCTLNSEEGLAKAASDKPDLIVLDIFMPGIDGLDVLKKLKSDPETQSIPVLVLTSGKREDYLEPAMLRGANWFMNKPVQVENLYRKIERLIQKRPRIVRNKTNPPYSC